MKRIILASVLTIGFAMPALAQRTSPEVDTSPVNPTSGPTVDNNRTDRGGSDRGPALYINRQARMLDLDRPFLVAANCQQSWRKGIAPQLRRLCEIRLED